MESSLEEISIHGMKPVAVGAVTAGAGAAAAAAAAAFLWQCGTGAVAPSAELERRTDSESPLGSISISAG